MIFARSALAVAAMIGVGTAGSAASAVDCRVLEQRSYRPSPQQPTAQSDLEHPRKVVCGTDDLDHLLVGDYCIQQVGTIRFVRARVYASGNRVTALRALLSLQIESNRSFVDIISTYVGSKRYFGEARDSAGKHLDARRVLHQFPQEDDEDVPPPCVNTSFVTVSVDPDVLLTQKTASYRFVVTDDSNHSLEVVISGRMIDAVLKAAQCPNCR
jgi:hypothetical protein